MKVTVIQIVIGELAIVNKAIGTWTGGVGYKRTNGDHLNYGITEIGQNTKKSPGDLWRLAVTQPTVKTISKRWCEKQVRNNNNNNDSKVKLATLVEGDSKAPFSIATTPTVGEGSTPFPGLLHFTLDSTLYCWVLSMEASSTIFKVFGMMRPGIERMSPKSVANTLPTRPIIIK